SVNVILAAAAYNFKRAMRALLWLIQKIREILINDRISLKMDF
ncbi:MAG: IS5/IS1182 family transposase, partial [Bacteroidaceae bacterium]|nr:IS5/IS1182 family transposase [Bacteroidaceae bacterium]MBO5703442.1 IS5/IS1182 family transposase [Bacteroidaceae bacterium]